MIYISAGMRACAPGPQQAQFHLQACRYKQHGDDTPRGDWPSCVSDFHTGGANLRITDLQVASFLDGEIYKSSLERTQTQGPVAHRIRRAHSNPTARPQTRTPGSQKATNYVKINCNPIASIMRGRRPHASQPSDCLDPPRTCAIVGLRV